MNLHNDKYGYGAVSQFLHWLMAVAVFGLFGLGLWMTSLTYYDPWYTKGPFVHEGVGISMALMLVFRLVWRATNTKPDDSYLTPLERLASASTQWGFYVLMIAVMVSGYLISTADGRAIPVFDLFSLPSVYQAKNLEDTAGTIHLYLAWMTIGLAVLHAAAALKHHFIDKDETLRRMLPSNNPEK